MSLPATIRRLRIRRTGVRIRISWFARSIALAMLALPLASALAPLTFAGVGGLSRGRRRIAGQFHGAAFAQFVRTIGDNGFAHLQATGDGNTFAFGRAGFDHTHGHRAVWFDHVSK